MTVGTVGPLDLARCRRRCREGLRFDAQALTGRFLVDFTLADASAVGAFAAFAAGAFAAFAVDAFLAGAFAAGIFATGALADAGFAVGAFAAAAFEARAFAAGAFPVDAFAIGALPTGAFPAGTRVAFPVCRWLFPERIPDPMPAFSNSCRSVIASSTCSPSGVITCMIERPRARPTISVRSGVEKPRGNSCSSVARAFVSILARTGASFSRNARSLRDPCRISSTATPDGLLKTFQVASG